MKQKTKYIVITGGVISGLGKGITTASLGCLLKNSLKVLPIKCDGYLNTDPGTLNPIEHGEVYVLDDGGEVDMDFGHYERFIGLTARKDWNITMGKIYKNILEKERKGIYLGKTVQLIPHVTDEIKSTIYNLANKESADLVLIEIGGTIGDMEIELFVESVRQMRNEVGRENMMFIHLTYVPTPYGVQEAKSKPTQQSVKHLNQFGIYPDVIVCRCQKKLSDEIKEKISLYCNIDKEAVISAIDVDPIYEMPLVLKKEGIDSIIKKKFSISYTSNMSSFKKLVLSLKKSFKERKKIIRIGLFGKYTKLQDSYASIREALSHVGAHLDLFIETISVDTSSLKREDVEDELKTFDGVIVPGGFGMRGMEGKIEIIRYLRENKIPFLGICLGMQLAIIEFARHVCGLKQATTREVENKENKVEKKDFVVDILPGQRSVSKKGGTMRLGGHLINIKKGSVAESIYGVRQIRERFRHRYEISPNYISLMEDKGLVFSGKSNDEAIVQIMELPNHPFFFASQYHPELTSKLEAPSKLFYCFIKACLEK